MLSGWRERGLSASFAIDPAPDAARNAGADLTVVGELASVPPGFAPAAVVLAIKPQSAAEALPSLMPPEVPGTELRFAEPLETHELDQLFTVTVPRHLHRSRQLPR